MSQLKALIFDVDGTLAETEREGHRVAFNRAFKDFGLDWHWDVNFYGNLLAVGGGKERIRHFIETQQPRLPPWFKVADIPKLHLRKNEQYQNILSQGEITLRPGVLRLLQEAKQHQCELAIATTSSLSNTLSLLRQKLGETAESWFRVIGAGDIVAAKKPAPDIYCYVLKQLGLSANQCVVLEDSEAGVQAAHQAGLVTIMTLNAYTQSHRTAPAALVVNHLGEPDQPCKPIMGANQDFPGYVNLEVCQRLLSNADAKLDHF